MTMYDLLFDRPALLPAMALLACATACGTNDGAHEDDPGIRSENPGAAQVGDHSSTTRSGDGAVILPENAPFTVTVAMPGAGFDEASLGLQVRPDQEDLTARFDFNVTGFTLKGQTPDAGERGCANSPDGQHIHFILNNAPYLAKYEASFDEAVKPGRNVLLAFLSRSYHESVKNGGAYVVTEFMMKGDGGVPEFDLYNDPTLFYSRPKGDYVGEDGRKVLLDFFLVNDGLSEGGHHVRATIDGHPVILTRWAPYFIEGLGLGEHTVRLELIDAQGALVPGPFNDSGERTFRVLEG